MITLDFGLHEKQLQVFNAPVRFKVVAAGRRFGKSYLSAVTLLVEGMKEENEYGYNLKNKECWYIAPTFQQAKDIMWSLLKDLGRDVIDRTIENTGTIHLINGRKIQLKGSDRPDTLRGSGLSYVVLDEYAFMKPDVWEEIVFPTLSDVKGSALFIGTPDGKNHFFDIYQEAEQEEHDDWAAWHFNTTDNPVLDSELIEKARSKMSSHAFRQEFEASFSASGAGIFKEDMLIFDEEEPAEGDYYIAVDPAGFGDTKGLTKSKLDKMDETAIAIVKVNTDGWWVQQIDAGRWGIRETAIRILRHAQQVQARCVGIEGGSLKNAIMPYLTDNMARLGVYPRIEELTHGGKKKTDRIAWALQGRFEHGRIRLNRGSWNRKFCDQLLDFPNPLSHDDLPDALAYIDQVATTLYSLDTVDVEDFEFLDLIAGY
jgi:phage terminase large subunit-like protein